MTLCGRSSASDPWKRDDEPARGLSGVRDVRVRGAIGVIALDQLDRNALRQRFIDQGVWIRPFADIV